MVVKKNKIHAGARVVVLRGTTRAETISSSSSSTSIIVAGLFWLLVLVGLWSRASGGGGGGGGGGITTTLLAQYPGPADPPIRFSHLVVDRKTNRVFAAGTNRLLQLDADLNLEYMVMTGPKNDSPACHAGGCHGTEIPVTLTDK